MLWLKQVIAALLEFFSGEMKQDKKASDADKTPEELKNKWRERIMEAERKLKNETTSQTLSGSDS
jgi:mannitol-1-phosphate/altronate dehydrogenase